ncbi:hypothetical protein B0H11DRAFT_2257618 [Mycena galericulata]|nr:hypothetical protein B0H11DRAFT_2257618 [Mycena galericulata]
MAATVASEDDSAEYLDPEFLDLLANLDLTDIAGCSDRATARVNLPPPPPSLPPRPPRSTSPPRPHAVIPRTFPNTPPSPTVYRFCSPTMQGYTSDWSEAAAATQGVCGPHVYTVQSSPKARRKNRVYVVFCGCRSGVFHTWAETEPLVSGVHNCIFRGYSTTAEAHAAFRYALQRSWVRSYDDSATISIPALPVPGPLAEINPLNGAEILNSKWFVVYRGISPGVYRSHLEAQLNTLGVKGVLHESIEGKAAALAKYAAAFETLCVRPRLTEHEIKLQRQAVRREKARLRMAKICAELKTRPLAEQKLAAEHARAYQAKYCAKNREELRLWEAQRRMEIYKAKFGTEAYAAYLKARRERRRRCDKDRDATT